jgi:hypothetical protein
VAAGSLASAFGDKLAATNQSADKIPLPTTLAGLSLKVKDSANVERTAGLLFAGPTQVNYEIPPRSATGLRRLLSSADGSTASGTIEIAAGPQRTFVRLDQVSIRLSRSLIGRGKIDVVLTVGGQASNNVRISIR